MAARPDIRAARKLLLAGEATSEELARQCLGRIEALNPRYHAFLHWDAEEVLDQARRADRLLAENQAGDRPLLGIPIALKDNLAARGQPLTCGSRLLRSFRSPYDGTVARRLREAGAVLLGRTNMDEFAMGSSTENSAFGPTANPWDPERTPGGSSGGAAAAVVLEQCLGAMGSDTGGSVRQPAAFCGCVGLKPSYGRVSRHGLVAFASSLDQVGPLTGTVADSALLLQAVAGADPSDATCAPSPAPDCLGGLEEPLEGMRIGLPREYYIGGLDPELKALLEAAQSTLEDLGARMVEVSLPHTEYAVACYYLIATAEASANLARFDGIRYGSREEGESLRELVDRTRERGFGEEVKRRVLLGTYALSSGYYEAYYLRAQKARTLIAEDFRKAFAQADLLLAPTTPTPAFGLGEKQEDPLTMYLADVFTLSASLAGICAISVPCGFTASPRLPAGMQLLGPAFGEARLLQAAHAYQMAAGWEPSVPPALLPDGHRDRA